MIGTLFSIAIAILLFFYPHPEQIVPTPAGLMVGGTIIVVSSLFILIQTLVTIFAWGPIQKLEASFTPRVMAVFKKDRNLRYTNLLLICFLLFTYMIVLDAMFLQILHPLHALILWTIFLGVALDFLHHHLKRVMDYMDPFHVVDFFSAAAHQSILDENFEEVCDWIDTLAETSLKSIHHNSTSLSRLSTDKLRFIAENYLAVAKGITYHEEEEPPAEGSSLNHVSYTLFHLFQNLEMIFDKALGQKLEPICGDVITLLGKIALYAAKYDITMASYPVHYIGKLAKKGQKNGLQEVGNRATLTLLEVCKVIIEEVNLQYVEITDPFLSVITYMQAIAKDTFRHDKTVSIKILTQPLLDLKALFREKKIAEHRDTQTILQSIDIALEEFAMLETVMQTLPPMPPLKEGEPKKVKKKEKIPPAKGR